MKSLKRVQTAAKVLKILSSMEYGMLLVSFVLDYGADLTEASAKKE